METAFFVSKYFGKNQKTIPPDFYLRFNNLKLYLQNQSPEAPGKLKQQFEYLQAYKAGESLLLIFSSAKPKTLNYV